MEQRPTWVFMAYKTQEDAERNNPYFQKEFKDHTEMKIFSSSHSFRERELYPDYCSNYSRKPMTLKEKLIRPLTLETIAIWLIPIWFICVLYLFLYILPKN